MKKEKSEEVFIPQYLKNELKNLLEKENHPDLQTFVIGILSDYISDNKYEGEISREEEENVKNKLKRLGYLS